MSLATRCTSCGTVFRVVQDQLKVSEGWVRCGRCAEVFNALEGLFDLEGASGPMGLPREPVHAPSPAAGAVDIHLDFGTALPSPPAAPASPFEAAFEAGFAADLSPGFPAPSPPPALPPPPPPRFVAPVLPPPPPAPPPPAPPPALEQAPAAAEPATHDAPSAVMAAAAQDTAADSRAADSLVPSHADWPADSQTDSRSGESGFGRSTVGPASSQYPIDLVVDSAVPDSALPSHGFQPTGSSAGFLRRAAQAAQWERPRVKRALMVLAALLGCILVLQVAVHQRDSVAARWPGSTPLLAALCSMFGCSIDAPRALDAMVVESSGLQRIDGAPLYRLQVSLRNRASTPVLSPSLDLTLTDVRGETIARRALGPADFGAAAPRRIAPGGEWPINAVLDLGDVRVAGYNVDLFYP